MADASGRGGALSRRVLFWLAAMALLTASLFALERMIEQKLRGSLIKSVVSMAESYVGHAEASLDYGLPISGPGSVEEVLQPPPALAFGPDALTLKLERLGLSASGERATVNTVRAGEGALVVERAILDSHGEVSSRLLLSRSTAGEEDAAALRKTSLAIGIAVFGLIFALLLVFLPLRRASLLPVISFLPAAFLLLAGFGGQLVTISRQAAVLAVAETASDLERAARLGMTFGELVGVQDYLGKQIGSNRAINQLTITGIEGVQFQAGIESLGSTVATMFSAAPFSALVDLDISQKLANGTRVDALVDVQPILADLGELTAMVLVFWACGGALLRSLGASEKTETETSPLVVAVAPTLLFLVLFAPADTVGPSVLTLGVNYLLLAAGLTSGLLLPHRPANLALGIAFGGLVVGVSLEAAFAYGGAGLLVGVALTGLGRSVRTPHLVVALLPTVVLLGAHVLDLGAIRPLLVGAMFVFAIASIAVFAATSKRSWRHGLGGLWSPAGLLGLSWIWVCLGLIQASVFLLVAVAARHQEQQFQAGPMSYVLLAFILHLIGYRLAGAIDPGARGRWILLEISIVAAVLLVAGIYVAGWDVVVSTALAAMLSGAAARWSVGLPFVAPNVRAAKSVLTCVRLIGLAAATGFGLTLDRPEDAALPATMTCLLALAPLAYAMLAGLDPDWRARRSAELTHAA
ncbi:hypothetical protein ABID21_001459 [Pseudorhizobium tarimense]|uniref:Uncharacterized protein n=1 Tax=Pseudorhizobium tarimense TaxID=1079109 RepID=A0ABV2H488_9HYPH|nr:hypothetical protein [Pseudorhizobium tarimense]MCJ8518582.1 hypothetical protein [Pseudorhizobium tarimense]